MQEMQRFAFLPFTEEMQFKLLYNVITPSDIKQD